MSQTEGEFLKDAGVNQVSANHLSWAAMAEARIALLATLGDEFDADDLRDLGAPPHPNCVGAAFRLASRSGMIRHVRYRKAKAPAAHARIIGVWKGV